MSTSERRNRTALIAIALCVAGALLTALSYWPGLSGPFLFDDIGSLGDLGDYGGVNDWHTFKQFVFGGVTGPTGRPLSLLSFLIDGTNWPTDPWPFKRTNLVIHILNGLLIGAFSWQTVRILGMDQRRAVIAAALCALAWTLHPLLVSTVLYPVQRMAQLAATFCLLGLNTYAYGRKRLLKAEWSSYLLMTTGISLFTVLAMLSKENGALLPLLIAVFERTVISQRKEILGRLRRDWFVVFLAVPSLLIIGYLLQLGLTADFFAQNPMRGFSLHERLLTESRIVLDYLRHWFIPSLYTSGVFQDHFSKSTGLLQPPTTLISLIVHGAVIAYCWTSRKRHPLLAFVVLFFYAGHLLESTTVNLELYFEHRNYLPAAFLFLPVSVMLVEQTSLRVAFSAALVTCLILAGFTRYSSNIWSSYRQIVETAALVQPDSPRAQQQYSLLLYNEGHVQEALGIADSALDRHPDDQTLNLWQALLGCSANTLTAQEADEIFFRVSKQRYDLRNLPVYQNIIDIASEKRCDAVTAEDVRTLLSNMLASPGNQDPQGAPFSQLSFLIGRVDLLLDKPASAMMSFEDSLRSREGAGRAMMMAAIMASHEHYDLAMILSDTALRYFVGGKLAEGETTGITQEDILDFQSRLEEAMQE